MDTRVLQEMGLTDSESRVYMMLLENGPSIAGKIASKTGIHRRNVYDVTERLIRKGLVGHIKKNNLKIFEAANPNRFKEILNEKDKLLESNLGAMQRLYDSAKEYQETNFYKGVEGLKTVFEDQLRDNKEVLILGASDKASQILPFYFKWYDIERKKKKIHMKIISSDKLDKIPLAEVRQLPQRYANPLAINIYKDKVAMILWTTEPMAIVIKNREVAESYRKYFSLMWGIAR